MVHGHKLGSVRGAACQQLTRVFVVDSFMPAGQVFVRIVRLIRLFCWSISESNRKGTMQMVTVESPQFSWGATPDPLPADGHGPHYQRCGSLGNPESNTTAEGNGSRSLGWIIRIVYIVSFRTDRLSEVGELPC